MLRVFGTIFTMIKYLCIIAVFYSTIYNINTIKVSIAAFIVVSGSTVLNIMIDDAIDKKGEIIHAEKD